MYLVIVILLFIGGSCSSVPSINHCIESTGPIDMQEKDIEDLWNCAGSRGEIDRPAKIEIVFIAICVMFLEVSLTWPHWLRLKK